MKHSALSDTRSSLRTPAADSLLQKLKAALARAVTVTQGTSATGLTG
jgi:hypothetical protein